MLAFSDYHQLFLYQSAVDITLVWDGRFVLAFIFHCLSTYKITIQRASFYSS